MERKDSAEKRLAAKSQAQPMEDDMVDLTVKYNALTSTHSV